MSLPVRTHIDLGLNQLLAALAENVTADPATPAAGRLIYRTDVPVFKVGNGTAWISFYASTTRLDQIVAPQAALALNGQKITGMADPGTAQDAATKAYVDAVAQGQDWKASVRVASVGNVALGAPGAVIDGVTLATGERVLLKNQTTASENGLWVFNGPASPLTRAPDADAASDVTAGMTVPVEEGATNAHTLWILTTNGPITLGTTGLVFSQLPTTTISAGTGLQLVGAVLSLITPVAVTNGGTGSGTAAGARANLGAVGKIAVDITGNGAATSFAIPHSLGTTDIQVQVWEVSTNSLVLVETVRTDANTATVIFAVAPANAKVYRVIVMG